MRRTALALVAAATLAAATLAFAAPVAGVPQTGVVEISTGYGHTCARLTDATAKCWGDNQSGDLGDGTAVARQLPVVVENSAGTGPLGGITQIVAGNTMSCALLADTTAECWGRNDAGRLGDGTTVNRPLPVAVKNETGSAPLTGIAQIATGSQHTCALMTDATARCWGANRFGELGDGAATLDASNPLPIVVDNETGTGPLTRITQIAAGLDATCARLGDDTARCWGNNDFHQLGDGTTTTRLLPIVVKNETGAGPLVGVAQVTTASGFGFSCARLTDSSVRCWGDNRLGQLGNNSTTSESFPVAVDDESGSATLTGVTSVIAGYGHACALGSDASARCWGDDNYGELGDGKFTNRKLPVLVDNEIGTGALTGIAAIVPSQFRTCALMNDATARCWGANIVGDGSTPAGSSGPGNESLPAVVRFDAQSLSGNVALSTSNGLGHTCTRLTDGTARCWGDNTFGELGDGTVTGRLIPTAVLDATKTAPLSGVTQIVTGNDFTCARLSDATARCWGNNATGQLGDGTKTRRLLPVVVKSGATALAGISQLSAGPNFACARLTNDSVRCWGSNANGQLGDGTKTLRLTSVTVKNGRGALTGVSQVAAGANFSCARLTNGTARCWGANASGQLGDGNLTPKLLPTTVKNGTGTAAQPGILQLTASSGLPSVCARLTNATARCWGDNSKGQLGDGTVVNRSLPVALKNEAGGAPLAGIAQVANGYGHTCAALTDSSVRCWGANGLGQIGDGTVSVRKLPVVVKNDVGTAPLTGVTGITAGGNDTCARLANGTARCWGSDTPSGQLGNISIWFRTTQRLPLIVLAA